MTGFDYVRSANQFYNPRTPRAALMALERGLLPEVAYIYKANSVKPLFEEPVDVPEIERILAREDNDIDTNLLLVSILEHLLESKDSELALFAAESINAIENRYNERIEREKKTYREQRDAEPLRVIAREFHELALINSNRPAIRRFYLAEAYAYMKKVRDETRLNSTDLRLVTRILIELRLPGHARYILANVKGPIRRSADFLFLLAEAAYYARDYGRVIRIMSHIKQAAPWVSRERHELIRQWTERFHAG